METFEGKQTKWEGIWWHPEYNGFSSAAINLSKLKQFKGYVRLYVRKNKYYCGGTNNRPNYMFCIKDSNSPTFHDIDIKDDETTLLEDMYCFTHEQLQQLIDRVACSVGGDSEYGMNVVGDYIHEDCTGINTSLV